MGREENFTKVMDTAHGDDIWSKQVDAIVHGFMDFLIQCTNAKEGDLRSRVIPNSKDNTKKYSARVVVSGSNGEEWTLQVSVTPGD